MKQNKCRAKRKDGKGWEYGFMFHTAILSNTKVKYYIIVFEEDGPSGFHEVIPETIGKYIGKCDKKGTPIYEMDIIQEALNEGYQRTKYEVGVYEDNPEFRKVAKDFNIYDLPQTKTYDVIGNQIDNPDLFFS